MTTAPAHPAPAVNAASLARHLDAIGVALDRHGIACQVTSPAGTPVLTTQAPGGLDGATVAIDPDLHARPALSLDCTCVWTPAPDATPQATAAVIAAVLSAAGSAPVRARPRPDPAGAARIAMFLCRQPGWSVFWDPRYGLWRAAEDDPGSFLYAETPDAGAMISYITSRS